MPRALLCAVSAILLFTSAVAQNSPKPLNNDDVITMFKGGLGESTIVNAIQSQDTNFDISALGLLQMKKGGITSKVMDAVINAAGKKKAAADAAAAKPVDDTQYKAAPVVQAASRTPMAGQPSVLMIQDGQKQLIPIVRAQVIQAKTKPSTLGALANDGSLSQAMSGATQSVAAAGSMKGSSKIASTAMMANPMFGGAMMAGSLFAHRRTVTEVWAIPGPKSETVVHNSQPAFEVHCDNIPGINPDDYQPVLLKLERTANNYRLVGATEARADATQSSTADWGIYSAFVEESASSTATKLAPGSYQLQAGSSLLPGEYAVALRPVNKNKKFSGSNISQNTGDGLVFNSVWSFEVAQ